MHSILLQSILDAEIEADNCISQAKADAESMLKKERCRIDRDKKLFLSANQSAFQDKLTLAKQTLEQEYNDYVSTLNQPSPVDSRLMAKAVEILLKGVLDA